MADCVIIAEAFPRSVEQPQDESYESFTAGPALLASSHIKADCPKGESAAEPITPCIVPDVTSMTKDKVLYMIIVLIRIIVIPLCMRSKNKQFAACASKKYMQHILKGRENSILGLYVIIRYCLKSWNWDRGQFYKKYCILILPLSRDRRSCRWLKKCL